MVRTRTQHTKLFSALNVWVLGMCTLHSGMEVYMLVVHDCLYPWFVFQSWVSILVMRFWWLGSRMVLEDGGRWVSIMRSYDITWYIMWCCEVVMSLWCHLAMNQLKYLFCSSLRVCMHRSPLTPHQNGKIRWLTYTHQHYSVPFPGHHQLMGMSLLA